MTNPTASTDLAPPAARRVMYIDDEAALVQVITRMLQRMGYIVEGFTQAELAIEAFRADPARIDLVVTDFNMPGMSGLDVARQLLEIRADLEIVITSGYVGDELVESAHELGIRHVIYKANTVKDMCETIHRVLNERRP